MLLYFSTASQGQEAISQRAPLEYVKAQLAKFAPVELTCDLTNLAAGDRMVLAKLVQAGQIIDELFLLQVDPQNPSLRKALQESSSPQDQVRLDLFTVMFGPWNRVEENKPFLNDRAKPMGAGFYPVDMSKEEFEAAVKSDPGKAKAFESNFTIIRRENGKLTAIPYHLQYHNMVTEVSKLLQEAALLTNDSALKKFLELRAKAFLDDDYYDSDMAWMDLTGDLEVVIGPYEVYEDALFNLKASYEAFICVVDHVESEKLAKVAQHLNEMEANLPIPDRYKNLNRGSSSPIKVVQEVYAAGDTKAGVQTTAFNLPNDERVREAKGSKKVMLKNIAQAKFDKCWIPIVNLTLAEKPLRHVSFDAYFNHTLMHEMSHGLGPGNITLENGTKSTVNKELKELYSTIEECKADVLGIYNMKFLMDKGVFPKEMEYSMYASYLGGMLRSIRFGIDEAHGGGVAIQFNYYFNKGAFSTTAEGKLTLNEEKIFSAVESLATELLMIQANGDYLGARKLMDDYCLMSPVMKKQVELLKDVPVDIRPLFPVAEKILEGKTD
jgi:hypothetical protein